MLRFAVLTLIAVAAPAAAMAQCREEKLGAARYAVCEFNPKTDDLRLFLNDAAGARYAEFDRVVEELKENGESLIFAMNAGMYHRDRRPVGLYIEGGEQKAKLSTKDGPGNFHLKPNGVFWVSDDRAGAAAHVDTAENFAAHARFVRYATQSGPMLVIDGDLHPRFLPDSTSFKRRNGVGVREDGTVVFAISDTSVTFNEFATYFRDALNCPNALYLDGTVSRLYAPALGRDEPGLPMGPIVGVVAKME